MYRRCTTPKTTHQQHHFIRTLLSMLQQQPFGEITVSALCERAGLTRNIFYRLFDSKQDVLRAMVDFAITGYVSYQPPGDPALWQQGSGLVAFFQYWKDQEQLLDALERNGLSTLLLERSMLYVFNEDSDTLRLFRGNKPENVTQVMLYHISGLMTLVLSWHYSGYRKSPEEMAAVTQYILDNPPVSAEN